MSSSPPSLLEKPPNVNPVSPAEAAAELQRRRGARRKLADFAGYTFEAYQRHWHHDLLCAKLDAFAAGRIKRLIVQEPPQHGKSEHVSRRLPAKMLGDNPDEEILGISYGADLAFDMSRDVQTIMDSPEYRRLYPRTRLAQRGGGSEEKSVRRFTIPGARGRYVAGGVGGPITGRGFTRLILDDYHKNRQEADSPVVREAVWKWYTSTFWTRRRSDDAGILICATRWNKNDLVGRLLKLAADDPNAEQWEVLTLPAIATDMPGPGDPRQPGEALWPSRHSLASLLTMKAANPYDFASLYQQNPVSQGSVEWPEEYFAPAIYFEDWPKDLVVKAMALDPSKGKDAKRGDYSAYIIGGVDAVGRFWIEADLARRPMVRPAGDSTSSAIAEDGVNWCKRWRPLGWAIEINQFQELLAKDLVRLGKGESVHFPIYGINNRISKPIRIRSLGTYLARGEIRVRNTPGGRLLVQQLQQFGAAEHDDGPDALEMFIRMIRFLLGERNSDMGDPTIVT